MNMNITSYFVCYVAIPVIAMALYYLAFSLVAWAWRRRPVDPTWDEQWGTVLSLCIIPTCILAVIATGLMETARMNAPPIHINTHP